MLDYLFFASWCSESVVIDLVLLFVKFAALYQSQEIMTDPSNLACHPDSISDQNNLNTVLLIKNQYILWY